MRLLILQEKKDFHKNIKVIEMREKIGNIKVIFNSMIYGESSN